MSPLRQTHSLTFLLDENVDVRVGHAFSGNGHKVTFCPKGISDEDVLVLAKKNGLTLITNDSDFAQLSSDTIRSLPGIIVLRIHSPSLPKTVQALETLLHDLRGEFQSRCIVLDERGYTVV